MKKGKLTNAEKQEILKKMGNKTFSVKKVAKELDRSEEVVATFISDITTEPQTRALPMKTEAPVTTPIDDQIKKLQDRIIELEQEKVGAKDKWKGKVRVMTQAQSERLDTALGRDPNSNSPTKIEPSNFRPDCVIKPLGNV